MQDQRGCEIIITPVWQAGPIEMIGFLGALEKLGLMVLKPAVEREVISHGGKFVKR